MICIFPYFCPYAESAREIREEILLGYDYHNGNTYKYGNSNLLWRLDKDSIAEQYATSLVIRTTGVCWNQMVCEGLAGNKRILLVIVLA